MIDVSNIVELYGNDYYNKVNSMRLLIFLTDKCNYICSYCYNEKPRMNTELSYFDIIRFVEYVHQQTGKVLRIELIGGEVTLHSDFIKLCYDLSTLQYVIDIEIYTNMYRDIQYYNDIVMNTKVEVNATWHSLPTDEFNNKFINKVLQIPENIFKHYYITVMFEPEHISQSKNAYNKIVKFCETHKYIITHYKQSKNNRLHL